MEIGTQENVGIYRGYWWTMGIIYTVGTVNWEWDSHNWCCLDIIHLHMNSRILILPSTVGWGYRGLTLKELDLTCKNWNFKQPAYGNLYGQAWSTNDGCPASMADLKKYKANLQTGWDWRQFFQLKTCFISIWHCGSKVAMVACCFMCLQQ